MKKSNSFLLIIITVTLVLLPADLEAQRSQSADVLLGNALHQEEVEGDYEAAIETYKKLLAKYPDNRSLAAQAQLRIGMCYEKLGLNEAQKAYKDVVSKYPEQIEIVQIAREKLSRLQLAFAPSKLDVQEFSQRLVWAGNDVDGSGKISPDGKYLSFVDWGTGNLAVREMATGKKRNISKNGSWKADGIQFAMSSVWTKDGKKLAYNWDNDGNSKVELYVIGVDGTNPRLILQMDFKNKWITPVDWTLEGREVLVFLTEGRSCQLALISEEDGLVRILKSFEAVDPVPANAEFSPDGRFIVFDFPQKKTARAKNISIISADGKMEVPLVSHSADDRLMGWSPDGNWILFNSDRTGTWDAWIIPVSDGNPLDEPTLVRRGIGMVTSLGFSEDGDFYYNIRGGMYDIFTVTIDPESGRILAAPKKEPLSYEGFNTYPNWSPDGEHLLYISLRGPENRDRALCIFTEDTGHVREIDLKEEFVHFAVPHWNPDNRSILVGAEHVNGREGLYTVDLQSGKVTPLILAKKGDSLGTIWSPAYTPDRNFLYYIHEKETEGVYRIIRRDIWTGEEKVLLKTPPNDNNMLSLSPDGKHLALILREKKNMRMLNVMPVEGGEPKELHRFILDARNIVRLDWSPDGRFIYFGKMLSEGWELWRVSAEGGQAENLGLKMPSFINLNFHPDGQRLTFASRVADDVNPEIWVMENFLPKTKPKR